MASEAIDDAIEKLKEERDELRVRLHLAKMETKDEFEAVERKWHEIELKLEEIGEAAKESAGEVGEAVGLLTDEIASAYRRIRKAMD